MVIETYTNSMVLCKPRTRSLSNIAVNGMINPMRTDLNNPPDRIAMAPIGVKLGG